MVDAENFVKAFGVMFLACALVGGIVFVAISKFKKTYPNFKYYFKYEVLKKKHNEQDLLQLIKYDDAKMSIDDVQKLLLLKGNLELDKTQELCYLYDKIKEKEVKNK